MKSKKVIECFQNLFYDCCSIIGLCGSCRNGLLALNHLELLQPSPPASTENGTSILMLSMLQLVVMDLHHPYDVHGWCLSDWNTSYFSLAMNSKHKAVLASKMTWNVILNSSLAYVDFSVQTSFMLILEHIRHQFDQRFSLIL